MPQTLSELKNVISTADDFQQRFEIAIREIAEFIPAERIVLDAEAKYGSCTTGARRRIPRALIIERKSEIVSILQVAQRHGISVYPISTGKNWGYGTANPVANWSLLLDLSRLNKIIDFDRDLATVRVGPGVTQADLHKFLVANNLPFLVPATGAGPHASLMGNLLERGYGITPHTDHFGALLALEAILPTGEVYRSTMEDSRCREVNRNFKWGLGPYLDGLFAQSNFGIVTECTISLMRKPDAIEAFVFTLGDDADLTRATDAMRTLSQSLPGILGGMNVMNARRMLAMQARYPADKVEAGKILNAEQLEAFRREHEIELWTGIGGIYGTKEVVQAAKMQIRRTLKPFAKKIRFINSSTLKNLKRGAKFLPKVLGGESLQLLAKRVEQLLNVVSGVPTEAALPLAYWKTPQQYQPGQTTSIGQDGCGLIWYSPLVVNRAEMVSEYVDFVEATCAKFGIEPLITLTTVSERCFDSTVPLLFDRANQDEMTRARECMNALLAGGRERGFFPYRLGIDQMNEVTADPNSVSWRMVEKIKKALDPQQILSPGRYCPAGSNKRTE